LSHAYNC